MPSRIVIIGNSGSGKSHLAEQLARIWSLSVISLDDLFWVQGSNYGEKRPAELVHAELSAKKQQERWIIEGVFGELVALLLDRADSLVWLDFDWNDCRTALLARGHEVPNEHDRPKLQESVERLLAYAEAYYHRSDSRSRSGHAALHEAFSGSKHRLTDRAQVNAFLAGLATSRPYPFALLINGPINAGKSTLARELRRLRPSFAHVEVDTLGDFLPDLALEAQIPLNLRHAALVARALLDAGFSVVVTYPLRTEEHDALRNALAPHPVHTVTLAPPRDVALTNRGARELTDWERSRIDHHYGTGLHSPAFGHVLDNSAENPSATAARVLALISPPAAASPATIRPAIPADAPAIARIHVETWRSAYRGIIPADHLDALSIEHRTVGWEQNLRKIPDATLVAERNGTVVGWVSFGLCRDEGESGEAELYAIYIDPAHQRAGLGRLLMTAADHALAVRLPAATRISLWVLARNDPTRRFYERLGYAPDLREKTELIGGEPFVELRYEKVISRTSPITFSRPT